MNGQVIATRHSYYWNNYLALSAGVAIFSLTIDYRLLTINHERQVGAPTLLSVFISVHKWLILPIKTNKCSPLYFIFKISDLIS